MLFKFSNKILILFVLVFCLNNAANAQLDCFWGIELYVRDESGKTIENAKVELPVNNFTPRYRFSDGVHRWTEYFGDGLHLRNKEFLLKVSAPDYKNFEQKQRFPPCGVAVYELRMKSQDSKKQAILERLTDLYISLQDKTDKPIEGIKIVLTNKAGVKVESAGRDGFYKFDVNSGEYSIKFINPAKNLNLKVKRLIFEKMGTVLSVTLQPKKELKKQTETLSCKTEYIVGKSGDKLMQCFLAIEYPD